MSDTAPEEQAVEADASSSTPDVPTVVGGGYEAPPVDTSGVMADTARGSAPHESAGPPMPDLTGVVDGGNAPVSDGLTDGVRADLEAVAAEGEDGGDASDTSGEEQVGEAIGEERQGAEVPVGEDGVLERDAEPDAGDGEQDNEVPDGTIADVLDWVGGDPARAARARDHENQAAHPRVTLIAQLDDLAGAD